MTQCDTYNVTLIMTQLFLRIQYPHEILLLSETYISYSILLRKDKKNEKNEQIHSCDTILYSILFGQ